MCVCVYICLSNLFFFTFYFISYVTLLQNSILFNKICRLVKKIFNYVLATQPCSILKEKLILNGNFFYRSNTSIQYFLSLSFSSCKCFVQDSHNNDINVERYMTMQDSHYKNINVERYC